MLPASARDTADRRTGSVVRSLHAFGASRGLPASAACLLDYDVIEAFCVAGLPGRAASTRGTYRSVLYALAGKVHGPPSGRATPFAGAKAPPSYGREERADLIAVASAQRSPAKRASALAMIWFGIGAGLRPGELAALRGTHVGQAGGRVVTRVTGPLPRTVPVTGRYGPLAAELARGAGDGFVFRPGGAARGYKNFVTGFAGRLAAWPPARRRRGCRWAGAGPLSSATTSPPALRSASCWPSPGSARRSPWPATPATRAAPPPGLSCAPGTRAGQSAEHGRRRAGNPRARPAPR
jgi:integrase